MLADIFCRVVDNYGDIGVCWRLARQLAAEHGWQVRLWVDDLATLARLAPALDPRAAAQRLGELDIVHWTRPAPDLPPGDVIVEAFACDPPPAFVQRMGDALVPPVWINLEYLSAEPWVESCHALPSPQPNGLRKFFFFPGFTKSTGGLLREAGLLAERDALQGDPGARAAFLAPLGLARQNGNDPSEGERLVTLFCYPDAPATQLAQSLAAGGVPSTLALPPGIAPHLEAGRRGDLRIVRIPFLPQPDYDRLLWCADLNFVRGEDSFVRAQWAARPMVWHIYPQEEAAHLDKLEAWLARYPAAPAVCELQRVWNGGASPLPELLAACLAPAAFEDWRAAAREWAGTLAAQRDLAGNLADFCYNLRLSR